MTFLDERPLFDFPVDPYEWDDEDEEPINRLLNPPKPYRLDGTTLYRYFDAEGALLYVGITNHAVLRALQHSKFSRWWPSVRSATFEHFPAREEAIAAETLAIRAERPPYNVVGQPDRPPKVRRVSFQVRRLDRSYQSDSDFDAARKMRILLGELAEQGWPEL